MKKWLLFTLLAGSSFSLFAQTEYEAEITKHREAYKEEFAKDQRAPLSGEALEHLRFFEPDEAYRVRCPGQPERPVAEWLSEALVAYRRKN